MERPTYPFPLAVRSSHHSLYHRFILGADPSILDPFPKPYCLGALAGLLPRLTGELSLQKWRKLYNGAFPWVGGFGPAHYDLGNVAPHCPLPLAYGRPARRFAAYDFVQVADPSVSALALVAGDRRVVDGFRHLGDRFCSQVEAGAGARQAGPGGSRVTGRILAGQFYEPNDRWLMPFLHVHTRVLNLTSFEEEPRAMACVDSAMLARAGERAMRAWGTAQAEMLSGLGYHVSAPAVCGSPLRVEGVSESLLAAMEAPRVAVLRILERIIVGDRPACAQRLCDELPGPVIAAMAEQIATLAARSISAYKPPKVGLPCGGPWRAAVREHLSHMCPGALERFDAAAARAGAVVAGKAVFPTPPLDCAHCHAPALGDLGARGQWPTDPELGAGTEAAAVEGGAHPWLASEFQSTLLEVNERIVRTGTEDPLVSLRTVLASLDRQACAADPEQLRQAAAFLGVELDRREREYESRARTGRWRGELASLDDLFECASAPQLACEREIGGRSP
jgi:hypothetical protein